MNHSFMDGVNAKKAGEPISANPHKVQDGSLFNYKLWRQGWAFQSEQEDAELET